MDTHKIEASCLDSAGSHVPCVIEYSKSLPWLVRLTIRDEVFSADENDDLFENLLAIRRRIEPLGWRLLCNGSRIDAYPSSLSRQMGGAKMVFAHRSGVTPTRADGLFIFGPADPKQVGTIDQQEKFYKDWLAALRSDE